jgi:hypothetical protein
MTTQHAPERVELKPYRQTWLSPELMHSAPSAHLCIIEGEQWAQLEHPRGGPLTCVKNRTGKTANGVVRIDGKWHFEFAIAKSTAEAT